MYKKGFTLIELLVVISIIGVLASIVMASLSSARLKARISNGENFRAQLNTALGDRLAGRWDLNECTGTTVADSSGYGANGTFVGTPVWSTDTPTSKGCALDLTNTDYVSIPDKSWLSPGTGSMTYAVWAKYPTPPVTNTVFFRKGTSNANMEMQLYVAATGRIACRINGSPTITIITAANDTYNDDQWHYYVCVLDRTDDTVNLYVDGRPRASGSAAAFSGVNIDYGAALTFSLSSATALSVSVANIQMYAASLTAQAVGALYAQQKAQFVADGR